MRYLVTEYSCGTRISVEWDDMLDGEWLDENKTEVVRKINRRYYGSKGI